MSDSDWSIEINFDGVGYREQPKKDFELRLQICEPDRLFWRGREVLHPWRVWRDGVLFSRDSHLFEMAVVSNQDTKS